MKASRNTSGEATLRQARVPEFFDLLPLRVEMAPGVDGVYPFQHTLTNVVNLSPGDFVLCSSTPAEAFADPVIAGSNVFLPSPIHPKRNYVGQWNLNIQRQLSADTTALIEYGGARHPHVVPGRWPQSGPSDQGCE
jgi:hypothetical protein